jgi:hypothetical protein
VLAKEKDYKRTAKKKLFTPKALKHKGLFAEIATEIQRCLTLKMI